MIPLNPLSSSSPVIPVAPQGIVKPADSLQSGPLPSIPEEGAVSPNNPFEELAILRGQFASKISECNTAVRSIKAPILREIFSNEGRQHAAKLRIVDTVFPFLEDLQLGKSPIGNTLEKLNRSLQSLVKRKNSQFLENDPKLKVTLQHALLFVLQKLSNFKDSQEEQILSNILQSIFLIFDIIDDEKFPNEYLFQIQYLIYSPEIEPSNKTNFILDLISRTTAPRFYPCDHARMRKVVAEYFTHLKFDSQSVCDQFKQHLNKYLNQIDPTPLPLIILNCIGIADFAEENDVRERYLAILAEVIPQYKSAIEDLPLLSSITPKEILMLFPLLAGFSHIIKLQSASQITPEALFKLLVVLDRNKPLTELTELFVRHLRDRPSVEHEKIIQFSLKIFPLYASLSPAIGATLQTLWQFLQQIDENRFLLDYILAENLADRVKARIKESLSSVLAKSCTVASLQDAYRILEMCDSLQLFNEQDNASLLETILVATTEQLKTQQVETELLHFTIRLFDEACKWGALTEESKRSIELMKSYMRTAPFISNEIEMYAETNSNDLVKFSKIFESAMALPDPKPILREIEEKILDTRKLQPGEFPPEEIVKTYSAFTDLCIISIRKTPTNAITCILFLENLFLKTISAMPVERQQSIEKQLFQKYFNVCTEFLKYANSSKSSQALRVGAELIINKLLPIVSPENGGMIEEMLKLTEFLLKLPKDHIDEQRELKEYKDLGAQLQRNFNQHCAMVCYWGIKKKKPGQISKAIELYAKSDTNKFTHFCFLLDACRVFPETKLISEIEEKILAGRRKKIGQYKAEEVNVICEMFIEFCASIIEKNPQSTEAIRSLQTLEKMWKSANTPFTENAVISTKIAFLASKGPLSNADKKLLYKLIQSYLIVASPGCLNKALGLIVSKDKDETHSIDFSQQIKNAYLCLSKLGLITNLAALHKSITPSLQQDFPNFIGEIREVMTQHQNQFKALNKKTTEELAPLYKKTIKALPLFSLFDPDGARKIVNELMDQYVRFPDKLQAMMIKVLDTADKCGLYETIKIQESPTFKPDKKLASERLELEGKLVQNFAGLQERSTMAAFAARADIFETIARQLALVDYLNDPLLKSTFSKIADTYLADGSPKYLNKASELASSNAKNERLLPVKTMLEVHRKFMAQPHSKDEFIALHKSHLVFHYLPYGNAEEKRDFLAYISTLAGKYDRHYITAACELIRLAIITHFQNIKDNPGDIDFSLVLTQVFLKAATVMPANVKPLNEGLKMNLSAENYTLVVKGVRDILLSHKEAVYSLKGAENQAISKLVVKTAPLIPLYASFDPTAGRALIAHFFQMSVPPFELFVVLKSADSIGLYSNDPKFNEERFQLEQLIVKRLQDKLENKKIGDASKRRIFDRLEHLVTTANFEEREKHDVVLTKIVDCYPFFFVQCMKENLSPRSYNPYMRVIKQYFEKCTDLTTAATTISTFITRCLMFPSLLEDCIIAIQEKFNPASGTILETMKREITNNPTNGLLEKPLHASDSGKFISSSTYQKFYLNILPTLQYLNNDEDLRTCCHNSPEWVKRHLTDLLTILLKDQRIVSELKKTPLQKMQKDDISIYALISTLPLFILKNLDQQKFPSEVITSTYNFFNRSPVGIAFNALQVLPGLPPGPKNPIL